MSRKYIIIIIIIIHFYRFSAIQKINSHVGMDNVFL